MAGIRKFDGRRRATLADRWLTITWDELDTWAGPRSAHRGRAYHRSGRVHDLGMTPDGCLLARVRGQDEYVVSVWWDATAQLQASCSCPAAVRCKHAVAAITEFLQAVADGQAVESTSKDDPLWQVTDSINRGDADEPNGMQLSGATHSAAIETFLNSQPREVLADLVRRAADRSPELREDLRDRALAASGDVGKMVADARFELRRLTAEPGWHNHWTGEGHTPDYDRLKIKLTRLLDLGEAAAVVKLGQELLDRGIRRVGQFDDEGQTAAGFGDCLTIVFRAAAQSGRIGRDHLLLAIDASLADGYGIVDSAIGPIMDARRPKSDWSVVADELSRRVDDLPADRPGDRTCRGDFVRDGYTNWLAKALQKAGRGAEVGPLFEREAVITGSYVRLVRHLIKAGAVDDAQRWAAAGVRAVPTTRAGVSRELVVAHAELARARKDWPVVAAHAAYEFFARPDVASFKTLCKSAAKAGCGPAVRAAAEQFLQTGGAPSKRSADWPLPVLEYLPSQPAARGRPRCDVLIDLAIAEGRPADALAWYDRYSADCQSRRRFHAADDACADRVAQAVTATHPARALGLFRQQLDAQLQHADHNAYAACAGYLRKMRPIYGVLGRPAEWDALVAGLRETFRRRPRFLEALERLSAGPIVLAKVRATAPQAPVAGRVERR